MIDEIQKILELYLNIQYLIVVILLMEAIKIYFPIHVSTQHRKWIIVVVSLIVGIVFTGLEYLSNDKLNIDKYSGKIFISFLFTACFYSILVKPVLEGIKKKFGVKPNETNNEPNPNIEQ